MTLNPPISTNIIKESVLGTNLKHLAIIMDGNRRWAKSKGLSSIFGHKEGVRALKTTIKSAANFGIKYLTVYAFSTENWGRKQDEVEFLMKLLKETIQNELANLNENNVKIRFIGNLTPLNNDLKNVLTKTEEFTKNNSGLNLQIAINYGSRDEITAGIKRLCADLKTGTIKTQEEIDKTLISSYLYTAEIPDPDLLIRTGGEKRLSNYLLWQMAYTELYFTETYWPDFDETELEKAIQIFAGRSRRFGGD